MKTPRRISTKKFFSYILWAFLIVALIHILMLALIWFLPADLQTKSDFGQAAEVVGTFFSSLAFAGAVGALILQNIELSLQREEINQTSAELKTAEQAQEMQKQITLQTAQVNAYTTLVNHYHQIENHQERDKYLAKLEKLVGEINRQHLEKAAE